MLGELIVLHGFDVHAYGWKRAYVPSTTRVVRASVSYMAPVAAKHDGGGKSAPYSDEVLRIMIEEG